MQDWMFEAGPDPVSLEMTPLDASVDAAWLASTAITTASAEPWPDPRFAAPTAAGSPMSERDLAWMFGDDFLLAAATTASNGEAPTPIGMTKDTDPLFVPPADDEEDPPFPLPDVVVTPKDPTGGGPPPTPPPPPWTPPPPPPPPPVDPTGPGGSDPTPPPEEPLDCRDRQALGAKDEVISKPDDGSKEYIAITYRDAQGQMQHSPAFPGTGQSASFSAVRTWMQTMGITMSQVNGLVHNHPIGVYGTSADAMAMNRYPSGESDTERDWMAASQLVAEGAGGPGGAGFALYIIDYEGRMREFEYSDRARYQNLGEAQRVQGLRLPNDTTSDGSTCGT